jgi:hypothetical protein
MSRRMTALSRNVLSQSDRFQVRALYPERAESEVYVQCWAGERGSVLFAGDGFPMLYPSAQLARRAVRRINPAAIEVASPGADEHMRAFAALGARPV